MRKLDNTIKGTSRQTSIQGSALGVPESFSKIKFYCTIRGCKCGANFSSRIKKETEKLITSMNKNKNSFGHGRGKKTSYLSREPDGSTFLIKGKSRGV